MKKYIITLVVILAMSVVNVTTAYAGSWSQWYNINIASFQSTTIGFTPNKTGTHKIEFLNDSGVYTAGYMSSYWGSNNNPGVWNWWTDSDVFNYTRSQNLYAGSSDIVFRFIFHNTTNATHTFYYRFYTA